MNDESILLRLMQDTLISVAPEYTGNLKINGIVLQDNEIIIGNPLVPYAVKTTSKWKGKKNPNEGWVEFGADQAIRVFGARFGYEVRK